MVLAITGGVACGKTHLSHSLRKGLGEDKAAAFSCDEAVRNLLTEREMAGRLADAIGGDVLDDEGALDREAFRDRIFADDRTRKTVEEILHPFVLEKVRSFSEKEKGRWFLLIEVPLLYEVGFAVERDSDLAVGCSRRTQKNRLIRGRGLSGELAGRIIASQLPIQEKLDRAHFGFWNDGTLEAFDRQIERFIEFLSNNGR